MHYGQKKALKLMIMQQQFIFYWGKLTMKRVIILGDGEALSVGRLKSIEAKYRPFSKRH